MLVASQGSAGTRTPVGEGVHIARCVWVVDLGTQFSEKYGKSQRKVLIGWEFPDDTMEYDGEQRPKMISKQYTLSLNEKAILRQHLAAWRGKSFTDQELAGFALKNVLSKPCQMQIIHNENANGKYANIASIMAVPKGMVVPPQVGESVYFDMTEDGCLPVMDKLPDWIKDKIKTSPEYLNLTSAQTDNGEEFAPVDDEDGDLPF